MSTWIQISERRQAEQAERIDRILNDGAAYFAEARERAREMVERDMQRELRKAKR